eukprot:360817-Chlamydomonas_euryale.AAC.13
MNGKADVWACLALWCCVVPSFPPPLTAMGLPQQLTQGAVRACSCQVTRPSSTQTVMPHRNAPVIH